MWGGVAVRLRTAGGGQLMGASTVPKGRWGREGVRAREGEGTGIAGEEVSP